MLPLDSVVVDQPRVYPTRMPLTAVPSRYDGKDLIWVMASRKVVWMDIFPVEPLRVLVDEVDSDTPMNVHDIVVAVCRGGGVVQK